MDINNHPCFNSEVRHTTGRIHLPVAAKCNVQCNFCNRKYDCANENRPGVSTAILTPLQAEKYLSNALELVPNIAVVGIAGPGDPFANGEQTMETLEHVNADYPDKLLCLSSNGLYLTEYIPRLAKLNVSHVTVTVNAVDPKIGAEIYEWIYYNKKTYVGADGAQILLDRQTEAISLLKQYGIIVKINTVVIPRVNEFHVENISRYVATLGADIQNCIPLIPVEGTPFAFMESPSARMMRNVRAKASVYIKQMSHCSRCRADAVGLLGQQNDEKVVSAMRYAKIKPTFTKRPYIAVASSNGKSVDLHLGETNTLLIYGKRNGKIELIEKRQIPIPNDNRWDKLANVINDCDALLVNGLGRAPYEFLSSKGIYVEAVNCFISVAVQTLFAGKALPSEVLRLAGQCGGACSGAYNSNNSCG